MLTAHFAVEILRMPWGRQNLTACAAGLALVALGFPALAQPKYPKPMDLPDPYRLVQGWPIIPKAMNGGRWGEVIRVHVAPDGNVWVFHRCFNVVPPGHATCIGRGPSNPPILEFDPSGRLLRSFGAGLFAYPHGFTIDAGGNLWTTDVNDEEVVLGMPAKNEAGVTMGQEVLELSPSGEVLRTLGTEGIAGNGPGAFDRPTGVAIAPDGDIFVSDGHYRNAHNSARVVKFSKDGHFIKSWGRLGFAPGEFDEPHDIFIGGSQERVYVADRKNSRIQVFDQDGNLLAAWKQFGQPSSVFVGKDDTIYVGAAFPDSAAKKGLLRGIVVGSAKDGSLKAFIPDPADPDKLDVGTTASGIAADAAGNIYAADVAAHNLRKYERIR
jgi:DNA-binding beta-propeller fold protein YncE